MKRIQAPKFRMGRHVLNEYELRHQIEEALRWGNRFKFKCLSDNETYEFFAGVFTNSEGKVQVPKSLTSLSLFRYDKAEYLENYYVISVGIEEYSENLGALDEDPFQGLGGRLLTAQDWTEDFMEKYSQVLWGEDLDWIDTIDAFLSEKLSNLKS